MNLRVRGILPLLAVMVILGPFAQAQPNVNVDSKAVNIWSDGTRLSGNLFWPKSAKEGEKLPAILLCHGWGGVKQHLNTTYAPKFASEGYVVLAFDYRGWGESDSRLVILGDAPKPDANNEATVKVQMIRELVDPFDQLRDIQGALNFLEGESIVDTNRIGIWGTSMGGGLVIQTAIDDPRIKCVVSQVGAMDGRGAADTAGGGVEALHQRAIRRARGEEPPVPQGVDKVGELRGTPYLERFVDYAPVTQVDGLKAPTLFIDAEKEELFDNKQHGGLAYEKIKDRVKSKYHLEPGITHYGIYRERYIQGSQMAIEWFNENLK